MSLNKLSTVDPELCLFNTLLCENIFAMSIAMSITTIKMKKNLLILILTFCTYIVNAQFETAKQVYSSNNLNSFIQNAKKIAILPFNSKISFKRVNWNRKS